MEWNIRKPALFYGNNLDILPKYFSNDSIDFIYLDPPFNSQATYNILFQEPSGEPSQAQITAFDDTWHWTEDAERIFSEIVKNAPSPLVEMTTALRGFIKRNDMMAYLVNMTAALLECHRVLKSTGSIYLHCDPTASHYLKIIMDTIFGFKNFRNEIIWKRTTAHATTKRLGRIHDVILLYSKSDNYYWKTLKVPLEPEYVETFYRYEDKKGPYQLTDLTGAGATKGESGQTWRGYDPTARKRHWAVPQGLVEELVGKSKAESMSVIEKLELLYKKRFIIFSSKGVPRVKRYIKDAPLQDLWADIPPISSQAKERMSYPTQKPIALLARIIESSAPPEGVVLDPFCGCGTTIAATIKLNEETSAKRVWVGIDITHLAINLIKYRLLKDYGLTPNKDYQVVGEPADLGGARALANQNRMQFQWWALSLVNAKPEKGEKKRGPDRGVDGIIFWQEGKEVAKCMVSVKSGKVGVKDVRDLRGVVQREKAAVGLLITLEDSTRQMREEAAQAGLYELKFTGKKYPVLQIRTIEELLAGRKPELPELLVFDYRNPKGNNPSSGQPNLF